MSFRAADVAPGRRSRTRGRSQGGALLIRRGARGLPLPRQGWAGCGPSEPALSKPGCPGPPLQRGHRGLPTTAASPQRGAGAPGQTWFRPVTQGRKLCDGSEHKVGPRRPLTCLPRLLGVTAAAPASWEGILKVNLTALPGPQISPWRGPGENGGGRGQAGRQRSLPVTVV